MIHELSNGVEVSEDTIISALKKAGINVKPVKCPPKYIFKAGDVVENTMDDKRIIVRNNGVLQSYDIEGGYCSTGQQQFENNDYKYIGKLSDFIK